MRVGSNCEVVTCEGEKWQRRTVVFTTTALNTVNRAEFSVCCLVRFVGERCCAGKPVRLRRRLLLQGRFNLY